MASTTVSVFQPNPSPPPPLSQSVAYQIDYAHSGRATFGGGALSFPPTAHWAVTLDGNLISYPIVADGKVFVLSNAPPAGASYGTTLYALDAQTGSFAWGPTPVPGTYSFAGIAYDHGVLFVVNFDGLLRTFDAATGVPGWNRQLPVTQVTSPPTAVNGIVYIPGSGGLSATDEATGSVIFVAPAGGDHSSPAVSSDGVFAANPCNAQKVDPIVGTVLWYFSEACGGGGGKTVAYANNVAYVRSMFDVAHSTQVNLKLDAATGTQIDTFVASVIPAFNATQGFFQSAGTLHAVNLATNATLWSFTGDGQLASAPIVIDDTVVIGSLSGTVYALDVANGNVRWSGAAGGPVFAPDEQNATLTTGLGAGNGYLVVPAGNVLNGWRLIP
jgi:outer membrane protein assembly factor BamB